MLKFEYIYEYIGKLAYKLFPNAGAIEHLLKLKQEVNEAINDPKDIEEYVDCTFAIIAAANKAGFTCEQFIEALYKKSMINENREWQQMPDGTHQHIKK